MDTLAPGQHFGRYRLLALIGRGGMGEVYLAAGPGVAGVEKRLAIKRLLPALADDPGFVARFLDEARLVVQLAHGNIVPVFEAGQVGRDHFLAMEFVDGHNLRELLRMLAQRGEKLPIALAVLIAHEVSRGLDYAHRKADSRGNPLGIIHRDVSPQNVLCGFDGEVRLVDFGIARAAGRTQRTHTGGLLGKFGYMSPEQALGLPLDGRSDLFALGAVLHELLTGAPLFDGETDPEVLRKVQAAEVSAPSKLRPEVPAELDALAMKLLARDPGERFASAGELEKRLGALRYQLGVGPEALATFLQGLYPDRATPPPLTLPGLEALPPVREATASLEPSAVRVKPRRWPAIALGLAVPAAALAGYFAPRSKPVQAVPVVVAEPPKPAPVAVVEPAPIPTPTAAPAPVAAPVEAPPPTRAVKHASAHPKSQPQPMSPPPAFTPAAQAGSGTLSLRVNPWGAIEIDGKAAGETAALVRHPLSAGPHEIVVRNPALGRERRFTIQLAAGQDLVQRVDLDR